MSPRRYKLDRRKAAMDETRRRIVEATVALHAEKGGMATTYAMIAERADVAVPTVYKHFPTLRALFTACTGHVEAQAPPLGPEMFEGEADLDARVKRLAEALCASWRFRAPWMRRGIHEMALIPEIADMVQAWREALRGLIALALTPGFGTAPPAKLVTLCEVLLDFTAWQRLSADGTRDDADVAPLLAQALMAIIRDRAPEHGRRSRIEAHNRRLG